METGSGDFFKFKNPLDETDLRAMKERIKEMNIIYHSQGFLSRMKGVLAKDPEERKRLLQISEKYFQRAVSICSRSKVSLRNYGDILSFTGNNCMADHIFTRCIELDPNDTNSLFKYGEFSWNNFTRL